MSRAGAFGRFAAEVVLVAAGLAALGFFPTRRLAGDEAVPAMLAGCAVAVAAGLAGGLVTSYGPSAWRRSAAAALAPQLVRLAALALFGAAVALAGNFAIRPLLVWIALAALALLVVDTRHAVKQVRAMGDETNDDVEMETEP